MIDMERQCGIDNSQIIEGIECGAVNLTALLLIL